MVVRKITLGAREFTVAGITLGTARRLPAALNLASRVLKNFADADESVNLAPTPDEADAIVALIVDGVTAAKVDTGVTTDVVNDLLNELSVADGTVQMFNALAAMFKSDAKIASEQEEPSGNSEGSKSTT